jgi:hypothetical protein
MTNDLFGHIAALRFYAEGARARLCQARTKSGKQIYSDLVSELEKKAQDLEKAQADYSRDFYKQV